MTRFERKQIILFNECGEGETVAEVLVDRTHGRGRIAYLREEAPRHYVGDFGSSPVYGRNPHGVAWYRLWFDYRAPLDSDGSVISGAWRQSSGGRQGACACVIDGRMFSALESAWRRQEAGASAG